MFDYFAKNQQALDSLRAPVYEDKVVDAILEDASVTEKPVSAEALMEDDDDNLTPKAKKPAKKATAKKKADDGETAEKKPAKKAPAKKAAKKKA